VIAFQWVVVVVPRLRIGTNKVSTPVTVGGVMCGYCAMGKFNMAQNTHQYNDHDITIAVTGFFINVSAIIISFLYAA